MRREKVRNHYPLNPQILADINLMRRNGDTLSKIANKYGCSASRIHLLIIGEFKRNRPPEQEPKVPVKHWKETPTATRLLAMAEGRRSRACGSLKRPQARAGIHTRLESLDCRVVNAATTKWLIKKGLWTPYDEYINELEHQAVVRHKKKRK